MSVRTFPFGKMPDGEEVKGFCLEDELGTKATLIELGATLVSLEVPDKDGALRDVVLGYDTVQDYLDGTCYFGAVIGPNGNRIGGARFTIGGIEYKLQANENDNNLHSGPDGFNKKLWKGEALEGACAVRFTYFAPDGESGFPGNRKVQVTYSLQEGALALTYEAVSDKDTVFNLTNHSYFNLNGAGNGTILSHELEVKARGFSKVIDSASIPTGECVPVEGTVFDFSTPHAIGERIEADDEQLHFTGGYDHNLVTDIGYEKGLLRPIAKATSPESGICMEVLTTCPCVQFYAGNFIKDVPAGKGGKTYGKRGGFCLETQVEPNAVNTPGFYSPLAKAGEPVVSRTVYRFGRV